MRGASPSAHLSAVPLVAPPLPAADALLALAAALVALGVAGFGRRDLGG